MRGQAADGPADTDAPAGYTPVQRLAWYARQYHLRASAHFKIAADAGRAEANYRNAKAQSAHSQMVRGASAAKAEIYADADPFVHQACLDYKVGDAMREASRLKCRQLETAIEACRTEIATEREQDKLAASSAEGHA